MITFNVTIESGAVVERFTVDAENRADACHKAHELFADMVSKRCAHEAMATLIEPVTPPRSTVYVWKCVNDEPGFDDVRYTFTREPVRPQRVRPSRAANGALLPSSLYNAWHLVGCVHNATIEADDADELVVRVNGVLFDTWKLIVDRHIKRPEIDRNNSELKALFVDWFNNYLTVSKFADDHGFDSESKAIVALELGRTLHNWGTLS